MIYKLSQKEEAHTKLNELFEKKRHVKIERVTKTKSLSQNAYCWLVFTFIADETGNSKDDMYQYYLDKFPVFSEVEINGVIHSVKITLSRFTKEQTSKFIDQLVIDARIEGFDVPDPEDKKTVDMYNYYKERGLI